LAGPDGVAESVELTNALGLAEIASAEHAGVAEPVGLAEVPQLAQPVPPALGLGARG
jgi:hypothetical protein